MYPKSSIPLLALLALFAGVRASNASADPTPAPPNVVLETSRGTHVLTDPSKLAGLGALRSAGRTVELAMTAVAADAAGLAAEEAALGEEVEAYEAKRAADQATWDAIREDHDAASSTFRAHYDAYEARRVAHNADAADQRAEVEASNALAPEDRDAATVARLTDWGARIDARKATLDAAAGELRGEGAALDRRTAEALEFQRTTDEANRAIYDDLVAKIGALRVRQGEAYRQLEACHAYALEIEAILKDRYRVETSPIPSKTWHEAEEALHELAGKGFDGNETKPPLR